MELVEYFRQQFAFDEWANREVLRALRPHPDSAPRPLQLMAHILGAERIWLDRLELKPQSIPVWPGLDLAECEAHAAALAKDWRGYLGTLSSAKLSESVSYSNSKGERWSSKVQDVLTHVILHSAYHRGQIATAMRGNDQTPAYTDFIHAVRQKLIE